MSKSESAKTTILVGSNEALKWAILLSSLTTSTSLEVSSTSETSLSVSSELLSSSITGIGGCPSGKAVSIKPLNLAAITKLLFSDSNSSKRTFGSVTLSTKDLSISIASEEEVIRGSKLKLPSLDWLIAPAEDRLIVSKRLVIISP